MKKEQAKDKVTRRLLSTHPLIRQDYLYTMVSHQELDDLIARLMHLAELDSDKEHREAMKGELKYITRNWLDNLYANSGYINYELIEEAKVVDVAPVQEL